MAKDKLKSQGEKAEDVTFESPVRTVANLEGPVSEEKAKEVNGYKDYKNIGEQVEASQEARGRSRDKKTDTGAKYF